MDRLRYRLGFLSELDSIIEAQAARLLNECGLLAVTAAEIEFYLVGASQNPDMPLFWELLARTCQIQDIHIFNAGEESGYEQFEVSIVQQPLAVKTARDMRTLRATISELAENLGLQASFAAKPFADQPGSGLHLHISLHDSMGRNVFYKHDEQMSAPLRHAIGGLMAWVADAMPIFAPNPESYDRFIERSNAPLTVSWGGNNRTVAIRLPDSDHDQKHVELRVAGADADPRAVMVVLLSAVHYGLLHQSEPGPQIFGDASLPQYNLPRLPTSIEEAMERYANSPVLLSYYENS